MRFRFHPGARLEFREAVAYYEERGPGLGLEMANEVRAAVARIVEFPEAWPLLSENTRKCTVNRFPYSVIYQVRAGTIRIVAVANLRRRPGYWIDRR